MGAPVQGTGDNRGNASTNGQRLGFGKPRPPLPRRPFNGNFDHPPMMRPRPPFGPMGARMRMAPPNLRAPPRGFRPPRGPLRMMRPPPLRMRPPPPHMAPGFGGPAPGFRNQPFMGVQRGRVMKRSRPVGRDMDLSKEWVTESMREEFRKKEQMLVVAKSEENEAAWAAYRAQRDKCGQMYHAAEMEFVGLQESTDHTENGESLFCDVCDQEFYSQDSYENHVAEHRVCGVDGCQYAAHHELVETHIETQHLTGLYEKIRSVNTPEDIAKWIEERKVKYPTKENVQKRYERQEEMLKRGEKIGERKNRFGRDRTRLSQFRRRKCAKKKPTRAAKVHPKPKESLIDETCDWNGSMFPFRGTKDLYGEDAEKASSDYDDDEWSMETGTSTVELNNALGALMGAYMSDDEQNDEAPLEEKIQREQVEFPNDKPQNVENTIKQTKRRKAPIGKKQKIPKLEDNALESALSRLNFRERKVTLLEKLLDSEIRHERNVLLQCVQYVVVNNFFRSA